MCGRIYEALVLYLKVKHSGEAQRRSSSVSPSPQVATATTWFLAVSHSPLNAVTWCCYHRLPSGAVRQCSSMANRVCVGTVQ